MGGRFYTHYFLAALPSSMFLMALFMDAPKCSKTATYGFAALGLILFVGPVWSVEGSQPDQQAFPVGSVAERQYHALYWIQNRRLGQGVRLPAEEIAGWVRDRTSESDMIYVWGYDPRIGFLANRAFPTRYVHLHPLGASGFNREARIGELARDLESRRPEYIIDESAILPSTAPPLGPGPTPQSSHPLFRLDGYEPVKKVVAEHYQPVDQVWGCLVYELR